MVRVRIAPSPTGFMHVGTARTALFNWLFARKNNGVFILRIEDTDKERSRKEYEDSIFKGLEWLGLEWDEGPVFANERSELLQKPGSSETPAGAKEETSSDYRGDYAPYRQSERGEIYSKYIKKLLESGSAFLCYHSKEDLDREKEEQVAKKEAPRHVCDKNSKFEIRNSKLANGGVIRFNNPGGKVIFNDLVRGEIEFDVGLLGDFSIAKDEETPLYNLAAAIDDYEMKISHVIRGEDHISNTPKQLLIYDALGVTAPLYAHLPMILGPDKSKLSKRHGASALLEYKNIGYLPDAMFNFLSLLAWNPKDNKEVLSREEILNAFSLEAVQKSGAVFNIDKLNWMNGEYIRGMQVEELTELCLPYLFREEVDFDWIKKIVRLEQPRLKKLSEISEAIELFVQDKLVYEKDLLKWKDMKSEEIKEILQKSKALLESISEENFIKDNLEEIIMPKAEEWGSIDGKIDRGRTLWPLRVAVSGRKNSPGPFEIMEILGKEKTLARIRRAIDRL